MEENIEKISAKDVYVKWGLILAVVSIVILVVGSVAELNNASWFRWLGLIPTIVVLILAHNQFKNEGDGFMSYGEGLKMGTMIAVVSSLIYTAFFYVYIKFLDSTFISKIREQSEVDMLERGMSDEQIEQAMAISDRFTTPEVMSIFSVVIGIFFGFVLSLIISAFTKNSNPELEV